MQYFSDDGNAMVAKSLHCRRERKIACVSCSATATQSFAQSLCTNFKSFDFWQKLGGMVREGQG